MCTLQRLLRLWRLYAWLDFMWVTRSFEKFAVYYLGEAIINAAAISSTLLLAERFDGLGPWSKSQIIFMLGYAVALHLTVVRCTCNKNGGPDLLLLGMLPSNARRGEPSWTPLSYSAPPWHVLPEARPARATCGSTRVRTDASCARRATRPSAPRTAPHCIACVPRRRRSASW